MYALSGTAKSLAQKSRTEILDFWSTEIQDSFSPTVQRWKDTRDCPGVPGWDKPACEEKDV